MPALLSAEIVSILTHLLQDIAIANSGFDKLQSFPISGNLHAHIAHYRHNDGIFRKRAAIAHITGTDRHDDVAVYNITLFINRQHAIRITVKCDANAISPLPHTIAQ